MFGMLDWNHQIIQSIFPCSCFFFYIFLTASDLNLWVFLQATAEMQNQFGWKNNAKCSKGWEIVEELRNHPRPRIFNDLSQDSDQDIILTDWSTTISHTVSGNLLSHLASKVRCQQCVCVCAIWTMAGFQCREIPRSMLFLIALFSPLVHDYAFYSVTLLI